LRKERENREEAKKKEREERDKQRELEHKEREKAERDEKEKQMEDHVKRKRQREADFERQLQIQLHEEAKNRIEYSLKKSVTDTMHSPEFTNELKEIVESIQEETKRFVVEQIQGQKELIAAFIQQQMEIEVTESIKAKEYLEQIMETNNKRIAQQHEKLAALTHQTEAERIKELEKMTLEQGEQKRREDESRLMEIKRKVALDLERDSILNKKGQRTSVSFSLFQ